MRPYKCAYCEHAIHEKGHLAGMISCVVNNMTLFDRHYCCEQWMLSRSILSEAIAKESPSRIKLWRNSEDCETIVDDVIVVDTSHANFIKLIQKNGVVWYIPNNDIYELSVTPIGVALEEDM